MNAGLRSSRPLGMLLKQHPRQLPRCFATSATSAEASTDAPTASVNPYRVAASVVLSRPPMLTQELHPFEESFYFYQRRLNQRLALPFTRYFYIKKGTPADMEWKRKQKAAGGYTGFGESAWKDELKVKDNDQKEPDFGYKRLVKTTITGEDENLELNENGELPEGGKSRFEMPLSRITEADKKKDYRSLDRRGDRTLYFLVKSKGNAGQMWKFPVSPIAGRENLKEGAIRTLEQAAGVNMNTWFVGNVPIGHYTNPFGPEYPAPAEGLTAEKVFFMKARIMAGQANLENNLLGLEDFMWLTKEEIEEFAGDQYYKAVQHMLASQ